MPAQIFSSQQGSGSENIQLLLLLKRQALEQKIAEHKLNVLGPLEDEFAKTNLDIAKFKLQSDVATAPLTQRRESALTTSAEFDAKSQPELFALQKKATEAKIGSETSQQASADVTRRAQEQLIGQREKAFPVEQQSAQLAQENVKSEINTRQETLNLAKKDQLARQQQLEQAHQADVLHTFAAMTGNPTGFAMIKGLAKTSKDPFMQSVAVALPEHYTPTNEREFAAIIGNAAMLSNDPQWAHVKKSYMDASVHILDQPGTGKEQMLAQYLGQGATASGQSDEELTQSVGRLMGGVSVPTTAQESPSAQEVAGAKMGPEQTSGTVTAPVKNTPAGVYGEPAALRTEEHIKQNRRIANLTFDPNMEAPEGEFATQEGKIATVPFSEWQKFIKGIPVDPGSGLKLNPKDGSLIVGEYKNQYHDNIDLAQFVQASEPDEKATAGQRARFTTLLSDLAKVQDPDPKLLGGIVASGKFTRDQINSLLELGRNVGWRIDVAEAMMKAAQGGK